MHMCVEKYNIMHTYTQYKYIYIYIFGYTCFLIRKAFYREIDKRATMDSMQGLRPTKETEDQSKSSAKSGTNSNTLKGADKPVVSV